MIRDYSFKLLFSAIVSTSIFSACTDPDLVGVDLQPSNEIPNVGVIDTLTIETYTVPEDSLVIWSPVRVALESPTFFLGSTDDPYYGKTFAGFLTQVRIGNTITSTTFSGATTPDSIVLSFSSRDNIGDTTATHNVSVYELGQSIYYDSTYYSSRQFAKGTLLGHSSFVPNLNDSATVGGSKAAPQLRVPLDTAFGGRLLREYIANPTTFGSSATFLDYFKGVILVDSVNGVGSILTLPSSSSIHRLTLYFSGNKSYEFLIDVNAVRFSTFKHEYLPTVTDNIQDNPVVLQGMAGLKDSIFIPHLRDLYKDGPIAISKAELVVKLEPGTFNDGSMPAQSNVFVYASDEKGLNATIPDLFESSGSYFGGVLSSTNNEYRCNIARHVQRTLKKIVEEGGVDYGLFVVAGASLSSPRRSIIQGGSSMKLIVTYTKINP